VEEDTEDLSSINPYRMETMIGEDEELFCWVHISYYLHELNLECHKSVEYSSVYSVQIHYSSKKY
jgi:hypothetical protein